MNVTDVSKKLTSFRLPYSDAIIKLWLEDMTKNELEFILQEIAHKIACNGISNDEYSNYEDEQNNFSFRKSYTWQMEKYLIMTYQFFKTLP